MFYKATEWYWVIPGLSDEVFSSVKPGMVRLDDTGYVAFLAGGNQPSRLNPTLTTGEAFAELYDVLTAQAPMVAAAMVESWTKAGYLPSPASEPDTVA